MEEYLPRSYEMTGIKLLDVARYNAGLELEQMVSTKHSQISAVQLVIVAVLHFEDAGRVDEQRKSLPNSQPRIVGLSTNRFTTYPT